MARLFKLVLSVALIVTAFISAAVSHTFESCNDAQQNYLEGITSDMARFARKVISCHEATIDPLTDMPIYIDVEACAALWPLYSQTPPIGKLAMTYALHKIIEDPPELTFKCPKSADKRPDSCNSIPFYNAQFEISEGTQYEQGMQFVNLRYGTLQVCPTAVLGRIRDRERLQALEGMLRNLVMDAAEDQWRRDRILRRMEEHQKEMDWLEPEYTFPMWF